MLAIWGRETDYGRYWLPYDTLRVVATQAYVGRRKDQYRGEFILALKILGEGAVRARISARPGPARRDSRSSCRRNITSTASISTATAASTSGIRCRMRWPPPPSNSSTRAGSRGVRWAYEVRAPANADCTMGVPEVTKPIGEWLRAGFVPVRGQKLSAAEQAQPASLLQPEGIYGPSFLTTKNYFVIKEYNFSDLYVLFVGHLSRPHDEPAAVCNALVGVDAIAHRRVEAMQRHLTRIGLYKDKIDGKAGMQTRAALGAYQKSAGIKVDCWPSEAVLRSMSAAR